MYIILKRHIQRNTKPNFYLKDFNNITMFPEWTTDINDALCYKEFINADTEASMVNMLMSHSQGITDFFCEVMMIAQNVPVSLDEDDPNDAYDRAMRGI